VKVPLTTTPRVFAARTALVSHLLLSFSPCQHLVTDGTIKALTYEVKRPLTAQECEETWRFVFQATEHHTSTARTSVSHVSIDAPGAQRVSSAGDRGQVGRLNSYGDRCIHFSVNGLDYLYLDRAKGHIHVALLCVHGVA
jgi:hypothetical protein